MVFAIRVPSMAAGEGENAAALARFRIEFTKHFPAVQVLAIRPSGIADLFEVQTSQGLLYTDRGGQFAVVGKIVELRSGNDITAKRWEELHRGSFSQLPMSLAFKSIHGAGQRKLAVFADPDCPYCLALERQLASVDNVTIYTFLFPVEGLHPGASEKARRIWCAQDPAKAWTSWMDRKLLPPDRHCSGDALDRQRELASRVGVIATPTLVFESGERHVGTMVRAEILQALGRQASPSGSHEGAAN